MFGRRRAFTLVELLVVITIISMLMAMLLPAVQSARERGRQATCMNNQGNIALGLINYESTHRGFPGYVQYIGPANPATVAIASVQNVAWPVCILPNIERTDLWNRWHSNDRNAVPNAAATPPVLPQDQVFLGLFVCPSDPPDQTGPGTTPMAYVANCGVRDVDASGSTWANPATVNNALANRAEAAADGVFHIRDYDHMYQQNSAPRAVTVTAEYINSHDGLSNTLLVSENLWNISHSWAVSEPGVINNRPGLANNLAVEQYLGFCWTPDPTIYNRTPTQANPNYRINSLLIPPGVHPIPASRHPGGVFAAFADRQVRFIREDIDYRVLQHIMTPDSENAGNQTLGVFDDSAIRN